LNDNLGKNKTKSNFQEKEISDLKNQLEEYRQNVEYIERQRRDCREEIESVRRTKDFEIQTAREES
jgi:prefoldin subunit 5